MKNHMKNRIAFKLTIYFSIALLLFSIIIGGVFMLLFKNHAIELNKTTLTARAVSMAGTLSDMMGGTNTDSAGAAGGKQGYGAYLRFLNEIAMTDVWVVDENLDLISYGQSGTEKYIYSTLPPDAKTIVTQVFAGETTWSEGFSTLLNAPTLTVGVPIRSGDKVIGALLLHSPVAGVNEGIFQGFETLLISIGIALVMSVLLSTLLAFAFSKPLKRMKNTAVQLTSGDYKAKTGVAQKDEIGELAAAIDVLSERLDLASRESDQLLALRREFIANISHELRTPVTVIRGSLEALCDEVVTDPAQVSNYHRQMLNESIYLQRLVNDLLDLSRLQNTDFQMEMKEISLCDVLEDVVRSAQHMARVKSIDIHQETDMPLSTFFGDYGRLRQMFLIILDNAVKFSPEHSTVTVSIKGRIVSIRDHGAGIPREEIPYIFDRFYKVKSKENKNGTGLGLAIAKQIAERHHVGISVTSVQNEGSEFTFQF
jgi:signal transduction histidine kinase